MNILCKIFGHKPPVYAESGWYSPGEQYGTVSMSGKDGTGRQHAAIYGDCARCDRNFKMAMVHIPQERK